MAVELCPVCGCTLADDFYEKDGVKYCCEPCATGCRCVCGCCTIVEEY